MLLLRLFSICFLFVACSVKQPSFELNNKRTKALELLIVNLSPKIQRKEALSLAQSSMAYSFQLSQEYEVVSFPWIQNALVNIGIKERGLCYEWAEDLLKHLIEKKYKTLAFHAVGANIGYLNEHNALSVSLKGEGIENSILLDAWRNSGILYFKKIREDKKYEWKVRKGLY